MTERAVSSCTRNGLQLKIYKLFISETFHSLFYTIVHTLVAETTKSKEEWRALALLHEQLHFPSRSQAETVLMCGLI